MELTLLMKYHIMELIFLVKHCRHFIKLLYVALLNFKEYSIGFFNYTKTYDYNLSSLKILIRNYFSLAI